MRSSTSRRPSQHLPNGLWYIVAGVVVMFVLYIAVGIPKSQTQNGDNFAASCQASLFEFHETLSEWLSGRKNVDGFKQSWERMRMDDDAVVIQPTGREVTGSEIRSTLQAMHGAAGIGFYTVPTKIVLRRVFPNSLLWSYVEEQHMPSSPTQIHATTALCEQGDTGVKWTYLHETKIEEQGESGSVRGK